MAKSKKYYVVWVGKTPGIYEDWKSCQAQTMAFPKAKYKSFKSLDEARKAFKKTHHQYYKENNPDKKREFKKNVGEIYLDSISVDAACSGNPGKMEYQGVDTRTKETIFYQGPFEEGTNNIGEFLALVHALAYFNKKGINKIIYSDSRTAISWVKNKKAKTKLKPTGRNKAIFELIERAEQWLKTNNWGHKILKWETKKWGEIPADFGRK